VAGTQPTLRATEGEEELGLSLVAIWVEAERKDGTKSVEMHFDHDLTAGRSETVY